MTVHHLKTIEPYYSLVYLGLKTMELRYNDRDFKIGDILVLEQFVDGQLTGLHVERLVTNVLTDAKQFGLMDGYCIMSIKPYKPIISF